MINLFIKNMVCPRCITAVHSIFQQLNIATQNIELGKVTTLQTVTTVQRKQLAERLQSQGFMLLDNQQTQLINQIKSIIIQHIHYKLIDKNVNFSQLLTTQLHQDYSYLSRLFSAVEGRTIENFVIAQRIEKVKELLTYGELTLSEIAYDLAYSSPAHLSNQFKKVTGMTPTTFKKMINQNRQALDKI